MGEGARRKGEGGQLGALQEGVDDGMLNKRRRF